MNVTDTLPALRFHARELITRTAGIREFVTTRSDFSGYLLDSHTATAIATASRALETNLLLLEQALAAAPEFAEAKAFLRWLKRRTPVPGDDDFPDITI